MSLTLTAIEHTASDDATINSKIVKIKFRSYFVMFRKRNEEGAIKMRT